MCLRYNVQGEYVAGPVDKRGMVRYLIGAKAFTLDKGLRSILLNDSYEVYKGHLPTTRGKSWVLTAPSTRQAAEVWFEGVKSLRSEVTRSLYFTGGMHIMPIRFTDKSFYGVDGAWRGVPPYGKRYFTLVERKERCVCVPVAFLLDDLQMAGTDSVVVEKAYILPPKILFERMEPYITLHPHEKKDYEAFFGEVTAFPGK